MVAAAVTGELVAAESVWVESHDAVVAACIVGDGRSVLMGVSASRPPLRSVAAGLMSALQPTHSNRFAASSSPRRAVAELASSKLSGAMLGRHPALACYGGTEIARRRAQGSAIRGGSTSPCVSWDVRAVEILVTAYFQCKRIIRRID